MRLLIIFFLISSLLNVCYNDKISTDICKSKTTCSECIQSSLDCSWCSTEEFNSERCDTKENLLRKNCKSIDDELSKGILVDKNESLSDVQNDLKENIVQMQPQEISIKLRRKQKEKFKIKYRQVIDYPVDLYYLMDLSFTMNDDKDTLASLGDTLANQMKNITKDFKLGFGSFVDKIMMPYVNTLPSRLKSPCAGCAPPYSFRNHMSLSNNTEMFAKRVKNSKISGNLDGPEGGLEAVVQAIVCKEDIGWRTNARKLLVYTTDAIYHQAGDGRLAGIYMPNDLKCHLDDHGYYNKSNYQDYPSINQLSQIIKKHKVNIIFAVTSAKMETYKELSKLIEGSSTAMLRSDSSNVVDLIKEEYAKITSSIVLKDNSTKNFKLTYKSNCLGDKIKETQVCKGLRVGVETEFEIELQLLNCPSKANAKEVIKISPVGVNQDSLTINVEMICDCKCEKHDEYIQSCSKGNGYLKCGLCECLPEYYGKSCECKYDDNFDSSNLKDSLLNKGCYRSINDTKVCSGNGECSCNTCLCDQPYTGKHCECDPYSCERSNNLVCGGRGQCKCFEGDAVCDCDSNWQGDACQCPKSNQTCLNPFNNQVCNNQGDCVCGKCHCNEDGKNIFSGKYCQRCSTCVDKICLMLNEVVNQQILDKKTELKTDNFTSYLIDDFNLMNETDSSDDDLETCEFLGNNSCAYTYKYRQDKESKLILYALKHGKCQAKVDIKTTVTSISVGTLIIGIITLILYKLITFWYDKYEFEMFEKQIQSLNWDLRSQNPLYKPSTNRYSNPMNPGYLNRNRNRKSRIAF